MASLQISGLLFQLQAERIQCLQRFVVRSTNEDTDPRFDPRFVQTLFNTHQAHHLSTNIEGLSLEAEAKLRVVGANIAEGSGKTSEIIRKSSEIVEK